MNRNSQGARMRGRQRVQHLKRQLRAAGGDATAPATDESSRSSILELLERSMRFGHGRLAMLRLQQAVCLGASLNTTHWKYCSGVAERSGDTVLQERFIALARKHSAF